MKRKTKYGVVVSRDEGHNYHVEGTDAIPMGVTGILNLLSFPSHIAMPWAAKIDCGHFRDGLLKRMEAGETISDLNFINTLHDESKRAHKERTKEAASLGSKVHDYAEKVLKGEPVSPPLSSAPEYAGCVAFHDWLAKTNINMNTVRSEFITYSKEEFYAGTCDVFAEVDGEPLIADFKTGSGFWPDQVLQIAAYAYALEEEFGHAIKHGWIIHLNKTNGKMTPYYIPITDELKADWEAWLIAWRAVKRNQQRHEELKNGLSKAA